MGEKVWKTPEEGGVGGAEGGSDKKPQQRNKLLGRRYLVTV